MCMGLHALLRPLDDPDGLSRQTVYKLYDFRRFRSFRFRAKAFSRPKTFFSEKLNVQLGGKDAVNASARGSHRVL